MKMKFCHILVQREPKIPNSIFGQLSKLEFNYKPSYAFDKIAI